MKADETVELCKQWFSGGFGGAHVFFIPFQIINHVQQSLFTFSPTTTNSTSWIVF